VLAVDRAQSSPIPIGPAAAAWALAWVVGSGVLAAAVVVAVGGDLADLTIPELALSAVVGWAVFVAALGVLSRREGSGRFADDYGLAFRPIDLIGLPLGALTQIALVPALYWPLQQVWPETFRTEVLEERAQDLADRADGATAVLLVVVVVVGAPVVEELVYRGLLQRSLANVLTPLPALGFAALWFGVIHLQWVELPGLFLAGLVFGACVVATGRIGMSILTHAAFNAVGIGVVLAHA
jgi:membrane protease YdiL (CAAX protease family)